MGRGVGVGVGDDEGTPEESVKDGGRGRGSRAGGGCMLI